MEKYGSELNMDRQWNVVALSIIPGLGHLYLGYPMKAIIWFCVFVISVIAFPLCLLVWIVCFISAWSLGKHTLMAEDMQAIRRAVESK